MIDLVAKHGPVVVMLVFMALFFVAAAWAYWPRNKASMEEYGKIPLKENSDGE